MNKKEDVEKILNKLTEGGEFLIDLIRENYFKEALKNKTKEHYLILDNAIENQGMKDYFETLKKEFQIELAGIHYLKRKATTTSNKWLPIFYQAPKDAFRTYKEWLNNKDSLYEHHLCLSAHRLKHQEDYIIAIDKHFILTSEVNALVKSMEDANDYKSICQKLTSTYRFDNVINKNIKNISFNENCNLKEEIKEELKKETSKKIFASLLLGARASKGLYSGNDAPNLYFYSNPTLGGIAFVSKNKFSPQALEQYKLLFRRLIALVGLFDGFISYWISSENDTPLYKRYKINNSNSIINNLKATVNSYLEELQLPRNVLKNKIYLEDDIFTPIYVVKRIGNRRYNQKNLVLIIRLGIKDEDAFNFLYLDNAFIFSKIEEFLNGWIKGYLNSGKKVSINDDMKTELSGNTKVRLDVYISPTVQDIEARKRNPYIIKEFSYDDLKIEAKSNFDYWNLNILEQENQRMPARVYRFSELVGPSIFVGEISSAIINHYWACSNGCKSNPLKVLDLFSGTSAAEATILKNCKEDIKIHFVGLDLNPYLLSDAFKPDQIPDLLARVKTHTHIIPIDIFDIFSHMKMDQNPLSNPPDIYSKGYDLVLSDPPHFLTLDFLYQKVRWSKQGNSIRETILKENSLMKHLAKEARVKCFLLYFGHKEKEWLSFFIHRVLSKEEWPIVWSILLGDERFVACFNKFDAYQGFSDKCISDIVGNLKNISVKYKFEERELKIKVHDAYYNEIMNY